VHQEAVRRECSTRRRGPTGALFIEQRGREVKGTDERERARGLIHGEGIRHRGSNAFFHSLLIKRKKIREKFEKIDEKHLN
jgi:hypothetical protein